MAIGSLHAMPWDHLILDHILWVSPTGDTLFRCETLRVSFDRFPFHDNTLDMKRVLLRNAYYHLGIGEEGINLRFVIDYFKPEHPSPSKEHPPFTVKAGTLELDNVHYRMDLKDGEPSMENGEQAVEIPHMEFFDIKAKFKDVLVVNDDVTCRIVRFSTRERSGFELKEMSGHVHVGRNGIKTQEMKIRTGASYIETDAELIYSDWHEMGNYLSTVRHEVELKEGTKVSMGDVAYWAPVLWGINTEVAAEGQMHGTVDSLWTDMNVWWGDSSRAEVVGAVVGLPRVDTTTWNLDVERMRTNQRDMSPLLNRIGLSEAMKDWVNMTDYVNIGATLRGGLRERATADIAMGTGLGSLKAKGTLTHTNDGYRYSLLAEGNNMKLSGEVLDSPITFHGLDLEAEGMWHDSANIWAKQLEGTAKGVIKIKGENLKIDADNGILEMTVDATMRQGRMKAKMASKDSLADFDIGGLWAVESGAWKVEADVRRLEAGLLPENLSTRLLVMGRGESLETLSGNVQAENTHYGNLHAKHIDLSLQSEDEYKTMELTSDIADASVNGRFRYDELPLMLQYFEKLYLPEWITGNKERGEEVEEWDTKSNIQFHIHWKDGDEVLQNLAPGLAVARGTHVDGSYNFDEQLRLVARSDSLKIGGVNMEGVGALGYRDGRAYVVEIESQDVHLGRVDLMERARIKVKSREQRVGSTGRSAENENLRMELVWGNGDVGNRGDLALALEGELLTVDKGLFYVGETPWKLKTDQLRVAAGFTGLQGGVSMESGARSISGQVSLCGLPTDYAELDFNKFNLGILSDIFLQESVLEVDGGINGHFSLHGLNETPYFNANLMIDSCMVNNQALDTVRLTSHWNAELNLLNLNLDSRQVTAGGHMDLKKGENSSPSLHFNVDFSGFELGLVAPFLTSFSSLFEGQLHGSFDIGGTLERPLILGEAFVENGTLKVDITDVTYRFSDSIQFDNNEVRLNKFDIIDPLGNKATFDGTIQLETPVRLDLGLTTPNILLLDKRNGEDYFGRLLASADGRVSGTTERMDINVRARTNEGCQLTVPITQQERVKSQHYITFVNDYEPTLHTEVSNEDSSFNFTLNLDLSITPDLRLNLPMDFDEVGADASVTGEGDLHFTLASDNTSQLIGNYDINSGTMKVALLSLYEKRFTIENGSNILFPGNIPDAQFDIKAVYSQRVNLSSLTGNLSNIDNTQKYIQVENIIAVAGTLNDPNISFNLNLPNADQSVQDEVFAYIDRNSERDMLTQTVSLLVNGKFSNVNNNNDQTGGNALDFVTSFVGNSLSDMVQFVDVNIDYKAATESTNQHLDVNISKDWGRWYLESTLGYGGESRAMSQSAVSGAVIDALIGYRVSPVFHLYAYNRTNTNDYTRIDLPFKQGAGMKLTKDFDRWKDLFKRKKEK